MVQALSAFDRATLYCPSLHHVLNYCRERATPTSVREGAYGK